MLLLSVTTDKNNILSDGIDNLRKYQANILSTSIHMGFFCTSQHDNVSSDVGNDVGRKTHAAGKLVALHLYVEGRCKDQNNPALRCACYCTSTPKSIV